MDVSFDLGLLDEGPLTRIKRGSGCDKRLGKPEPRTSLKQETLTIMENEIGKKGKYNGN